MNENFLSDREIRVVETIVRNYILTASPTSSRFVAKQKKFNLSAATIRNVMEDLEDKGLIMQPHKSAGRVPTDKGYRYYVDRLIQSSNLPKKVKDKIDREFSNVELSDLHMVMEATSKALSKATNQLGVILSPKLNTSKFRHLSIYKIEHHRYLMNLAVDLGFIKTIVVELETELDQSRIESACRLINERYYGMTFKDIFKEKDKIFSDIEDYSFGVIKLFIPSIHKMLERNMKNEVFTDGQTNILLKPEFVNSREQISSIIEILEKKSLLMHILGSEKKSKRIVVSIGGEIENGKFSSFSIVKTNYSIGSAGGYLGIIGPKRMPYQLLISAVDYTAKVLEEMYKK